MPRPTKEPMHKYHLQVPVPLWEELHDTFPESTMARIIRRALKLSLIIAEVQRDGGKLVIRKDGMDQEIVLLD